MSRDMICLDPGRAMGLAIFEGPRFSEALLIRDWRPLPIVLSCTTLVIEVPQIRVKGGGKGHPDEVVDLAYKAGLWAGQNIRYSVLCTVKPSAWKGAVPKEIMTDRIRAHRLPDEPRYPENHNEVDAIGLGLWYLKRLYNQQKATP